MTPSREDAVLVIDDSADTRDALRVLLELEGYRVETAENGQHGLDQLRAGLRPCLIVLDLMMPVKDGVQFRREQLAIPELAQIPIVVYSARRQADADTKTLGEVAYVKKPVDFDELLALVRQYC